MAVGAHVGVAGGYANAVEYAASVGCECLQVFAKSPRQWNARPVDPAVAREFRDAVEAHRMSAVLVHTAYLINLGSFDDALWERSWTALADELSRAEALGASHVVTHTGTGPPDDPERAGKRIASAVDAAWRCAGVRSVRLLLENTAGAGTTYGDGPEQLGAVIAHLDVARPHVGVCLDACHAHAAGWDMSLEETWPWLAETFATVGHAPIEAIHANDCMFGAGLRKDRHAWIGDGTIGYGGFAAMFAEPRLASLPIITEMPGEIPFKDIENVERLKRLRASYAPSGNR